MFDYSNSYFKLMDSIDVYWLKEYKKLSEGYGVDIEQVKAAIPQSELEKDVAVGKAIDFVKANAVITEAVAEAEEKKAPAKKTTTAKKTTAKKAVDGAEAPAKKPSTRKKTVKAEVATERIQVCYESQGENITLTLLQNEDGTWTLNK